MMPLALDQNKNTTEYNIDHNWPRWSGIFYSEIGGGDRPVFRGSVAIGAAQGRRGEFLGFLQQWSTFAELNSRITEFANDFDSIEAATVFTTRAVEVRSQWVLNLSKRDISREPSVLGDTMNSVLDDLMQRGVEYVNAELLKINPYEAHASHLMAVLRGLFSWRTKVTNWAGLRDKSIHALRDRGMKPEIAMKGLLD